MLKKISLANFKCFEKISFNLKNLNVLTGINSKGKSTVIQSLLVLRQTYENDNKLYNLCLNGKYVALGRDRDVLCKYSDKDFFSIHLVFDDGKRIECKYILGGLFDDNLIKGDKSELSSNSLFNNNFQYIAAERLGPLRYYNIPYVGYSTNNEIGHHGEYFASHVADNTSLIPKMQEWLKRLGFEYKISPHVIEDAGIVTLKYVDAMGDYIPMNVGFGVSYVAPIVLALLQAQRDDLIIIENPEAHIHPRGQRILGELIAQVASKGVQVIVETHSDHMLNGIRIAVKKKKLKKGDVELNYFYCEKRKNGNDVHKIVHPKINSDGSLTDWPDGFFDEWKKALEEIIV